MSNSFDSIKKCWVLPKKINKGFHCKTKGWWDPFSLFELDTWIHESGFYILQCHLMSAWCCNMTGHMAGRFNDIGFPNVLDPGDMCHSYKDTTWSDDIILGFCISDFGILLDEDLRTLEQMVVEKFRWSGCLILCWLLIM